MRFPRMTTRRWMITVAILATTLGCVQAYRLERQRAVYQRQVQQFTTLEEMSRRRAAFALSQAGLHEEQAEIEIKVSSDFSRKSVQFRIPEPLERMPGTEHYLGRLTYTNPWLSQSEVLARRAIRNAEEADKQRAKAAAEERQAEHYRQLKRKYERAGRRPWLPVAPDPPPPQ